jgi:hypothetical protein
MKIIPQERENQQIKRTQLEHTLTRTMSLMPLRNPHIKQALRPVLRQGDEVHELEARERKVVGAADVPAAGLAAPACE